MNRYFIIMDDIEEQTSWIKDLPLRFTIRIERTVFNGTLIILVYNLCPCHTSCCHIQHLLDSPRQPAGNLSNKIIITIYYNKWGLLSMPQDFCQAILSVVLPSRLVFPLAACRLPLATKVFKELPPLDVAANCVWHVTGENSVWREKRRTKCRQRRVAPKIAKQFEKMSRKCKLSTSAAHLKCKRGGTRHAPIDNTAETWIRDSYSTFEMLFTRRSHCQFPIN